MAALRMVLGLVLLVSVGVGAQGPARPPVAQFDERDAGRVVRLPVGAELVVRLPEQAGTAYEWVLRDSDAIRPIGAPKLVDTAPPGIVGGPRLRQFRLQVVAGGRTPLRFTLRSAFPAADRPPARRFDLVIDADTMAHIPIDYGSDDRRLITVGERDADGLIVTSLGRPVEVHLSADPAKGYHWEVLSSRNIAFERPVGVEYKPGLFGLGAGPETAMRIHTLVDRSDGFLELVLMPPGRRADRFGAVRRLSYQFTNQH